MLHGVLNQVDRPWIKALLDLERITLERLTFSRQHAANPAHRGIEAAVGQGLIHRRHFHRTQGPCPQQHGRECRELTFNPQPRQGLEHVGNAHFLPQSHSAQVVGVHHRLIQEDGAV